MEWSKVYICKHVLNNVKNRDFLSNFVLFH